MTEGAARFWLQGGHDGAPGGQARTVLLTADPAIAAEVASLGSLENKEAERLLCTIGACLRPDCSSQVLAAGSFEALRRGWAATAGRLLAALSAQLAEGWMHDDVTVLQARHLLVAATHTGKANLVSLVLAAGGPDWLFGAPFTAADGERSQTPMHIAARGGNAECCEVLATSPQAALAWFATPDDTGHTAAEVAAESRSLVRFSDALALRLERAQTMACQIAGGRSFDTAADDSDAALARLLLKIYVPSGVPRSAECSRFQATRAQEQRLTTIMSLLLNAGFLLVGPSGVLRSVDITHLLAAVEHPADPSFSDLIALHMAVRPFKLPRLLFTVAVLVCSLSPNLRGFWSRRGRHVLVCYVLHLMASNMVGERVLRAMIGARLVWPSLQGFMLLALVLLHISMLQLPAVYRARLLAAHWTVAAASRTTDAGLWPVTAAPLRDTALSCLVHIALVLVMRAEERRALQAWRASRLRRLGGRAKQE